MARTRNFGASETVTRRLRYNQEIKKPLAEKIKKAIELLQLCEENAIAAHPDGYFLAFSGGKDSCVIKELAKMAGVKFTSHYSVTTIDPPELVRFIKREHPDVIWERTSKTPLPLYMKFKSCGPPTRLIRWCCDIYKETKKSKGRYVLLGVRATESKKRQLGWDEITLHRNTKQLTVNPIVFWTEKDVWEFIRERRILYCELYDKGYKRLGCIGCPLATKKQTLLDFARYPGYEKLWKRGFSLFWERYHGKLNKKGLPYWVNGFDTVEELWEWWITGVRKQKTNITCPQEKV